MDTNLKNAISAMREDIAELEKKQKSIKPQRKTVYFTGERTMPAWKAAEEVKDIKERLRTMYAAYNLLRGKGFDITERNAKPLIYDRGNVLDLSQRNTRSALYHKRRVERKAPSL